MKNLNHLLRGTSMHEFIEEILNRNLYNYEIDMLTIITNNTPTTIRPTHKEQYFINLHNTYNTTTYIKEEIHANGKTFHPFSKFKGKEKPTRK